jgi:hypothetical protein
MKEALMDHYEIRMLTAPPFRMEVRELARRFLLRGASAQANKFAKADIEVLLLEIWRRQQEKMRLEDEVVEERVKTHGGRDVARPCWEFKCADPSGVIRLFDGACDSCKRYYARLLREKADEHDPQA